MSLKAIHAFIDSTIHLDNEQRKVWDQLQILSTFLINKKKLFNIFQKINNHGIYIWGPVGRGKTMLVNHFYDSLNINRKTRLHFQHFMKNIHENLFKLQGVSNGIQKLATDIAQRYDVICLDELYIDDIVNASIVGSLLKELYRNGVVLVITTNIHPDDLYKDKLHQERFYDVITLLKQHNHVCSLDNKLDYRMLQTQSNEVFFYGERQVASQRLRQFYLEVSCHTPPVAGELIINNRKLAVNAQYNDIVWFEFTELCEKSRSQLDYIALADQFKTILISNIPQLDDGLAKDDYSAVFCRDRSRRFISLIDEFYDRGILLVVNFEVQIDSLYLGFDLKFQFERVYSRLFEMQSLDYLTKQTVNIVNI